MAQFFVSYARIDIVLAEEVIDTLRQRYGYPNVWYDKELHNRGGEDWWDEILNAISAADIFIYLLSKESVESPYCQAEFEEAQRLRKRLIFIQIRDQTALPDTIASRQYANMSQGVSNIKTWTSLYNSIDHQIKKIPKRKLRALSPHRTPRPQQKESLAERPTDAPPVVTDALKTHITPKSQDRLWGQSAIFIMLLFSLFFVILLVFFAPFIQNLLPNVAAPITLADNSTPTHEMEGLVQSSDDARATGAAAAYATLTASAPTHIPTITLTPTHTPISSSDIQLTAYAEVFATQAVISQTETVNAQQTQNVMLTQQFSAGETATYIAELSLTPPVTNTPQPTLTPRQTSRPRSSATPQPETKYAVQNAVIRSGPRLNASVVGSADAGRSVTVMGEIQGDRFSGSTIWYHVQHRNPMTGVTYTGYTHSSLLSNNRPVIQQAASTPAPTTSGGASSNAGSVNIPATCSNGGMSGSASGLLGLAGHDRRTVQFPANATIVISASVTDAVGAWGVRVVIEDASGRELNYRELWNTSTNQTTFTYTTNVAGTYRIGLSGDATHSYRYSVSWRCE